MNSNETVVLEQNDHFAYNLYFLVGIIPSGGQPLNHIMSKNGAIRPKIKFYLLAIANPLFF